MDDAELPDVIEHPIARPIPLPNYPPLPDWNEPPTNLKVEDLEFIQMCMRLLCETIEEQARVGQVRVAHVAVYILALESRKFGLLPYSLQGELVATRMLARLAAKMAYGVDYEPPQNS